LSKKRHIILIPVYNDEKSLNKLLQNIDDRHEMLVDFENETDLFKFSALTVIGSILSFALNLAGVPAVLTPMADSIAQATSWPLETVLMSQINSFFIIIVPYQAAPIFAGVILTKVPIKYCAQLGIIFSILYILLIMPINYLWWHHLGMFS